MPVRSRRLLAAAVFTIMLAAPGWASATGLLPGADLPAVDPVLDDVANPLPPAGGDDLSTDPLPDALDPITDTIGGTVDTVTDTIGGTVDTVTDTIGGAVDPVTDTLDDAINGAGEVLDPIIDTVRDTTDPIIDTIRDTTDPITDPVTDVVDPVTDTVTDTVDQPTKPVRDIGGGVTGPVRDRVDEIRRPVSDRLGEVEQPVREVIDDRGLGGTAPVPDGLSGLRGRPADGRDGRSQTSSARIRSAAAGTAPATRAGAALPRAFSESLADPGIAAPVVAGVRSGGLSFGDVVRGVAEASREFSFPLTVAALVLLFLAIQGRIDARDPKLAARYDDEELTFA